jgi:antitoxin (DNA-binding transcriptional repressor) of toxin-antitoxin stability system
MLWQVNEGESFTVTRFGKSVAVIIPFDEWEKLNNAFVDAEVRMGRGRPGLTVYPS